MRHRLTILFLFVLSITANAQIGTRFWFAAPSLTNQHDNSMLSQYAKLCFSTYDQQATIVITQPGITDSSHPRYFAPFSVTLPANSTIDVLLSQIGVNRAEARKTVPYAICIESDTDIAVYFAQTNDNSEIYTLKGANALGTDFIVGMQKTLPCAHGGIPSVEIAATEDNTIVDIVSPVVTQNASTTTWQVTLNRGDVYTIIGVSSKPQDHLSGMRLRSNKPIAVNSTDDSVQSWGQDLCGEQLVPTNLAGTEYIISRNTAEHEKIYVYAVQDGTQLSFNGQPQQILNTGETRIISLTDDINYIHSDNDLPFVVFQLTGMDGETGATQLPKLTCTGSKRVTYVRRFATMPKVSVVVKTNYTSYFSINGNTNQLTADDFQPVPYAPEWSWCNKAITPASGTGYIAISNDSSEFHLGVLDCGGGTCTYGYFSDFNAASLEPVADKPFYTIGESMHLSLMDAALYTDIQWFLPDGTQQNGAEITVSATPQQSGYAYVKAVSREGCSLLRDSFPLLLHVLDTYRKDSIVCDTLGIAEDSMQLVSVKRAGYNLLSPSNDTSVTCSAEADEVWRASAEVIKGQAYQVQLSFASGNNTRRPRVEVHMNEQVLSPIIYPNTTPTETTWEWIAPSTGTATCAVHTVQGTANNSTLLITNPSLQPLFEVNDTIVFSLKSCVPLPPDSTTTPQDTTPVTPPDSIIEPYVLMVTLDTYEQTLCDGDLSADIYYTIEEGEPHIVWVDGVEQEVTAERHIAYEVPQAPGTHLVPLVFCDTNNKTCTDTLYFSIHILYQPLKIFTQKWDNTLVAYNAAYSGYQLDLYDYQWWQDGAAISGAQLSYLYMENGFPQGAVFYLTASFRDANGEEKQMQTCPYIPVPIAPAQTRIYRLDGTMVNEISSPGFYIITNGTYQQKIITQ